MNIFLPIKMIKSLDLDLFPSGYLYHLTRCRPWIKVSQNLREANVNIGVLQLGIRLPESHSLKEKRQVTKSLVAQLHNRFNVSAAEVEDQDLWQSAVLGVACISNDKKHTNEVLNKALAFATRFNLELVDSNIEIIDY